MPDFAPNFTARIRVRYSALGRSHSQTWRTPAAGALDAGIGAAIVDIGNYYADIQAGLSSDFAILSTSFARENEDIFLPSVLGVTVTPGGPTVSAPQARRMSTQSLSFVGRTSAGLRAVIYQYGWLQDQLVDAVDAPDNFRLDPGEDATIDTAIADLNGVLVTLCGNDGNGITWYPYANLKFNDYWLRKARQGS